MLRTAIKETPDLPYQMMQEVLKPYINEYAMTNNILQAACDFVKVDLFSELEDNAKYVYTMCVNLSSG